MPEVVGVTFKEKGRIEYCLVENKKVKKNITVIVEQDKTLRFGKLVF